MPRRPPFRTVLVAVGARVLASLALAGPASAGRVVITGHDADYHCASGEGQCHFVSTAVNYVRGGAPDPSKPVLVLDRLNLHVVTALDTAFGPGVVPREVVDPRSGFGGVTLSTDRYSAIVIASDVTCGGCDLNEEGATPDSDAINARQADITAFFNAGGGVYANAGGSHGDGDPATGADPYYSFLPIPVGGTPVSGPFCLTPLGASLGFEDPGGCPDTSRLTGTNDDINCCATHNSFVTPPAGSALRVAETDVGLDAEVGPDDAPQTLVAEGKASGGGITNGRVTLAQLPDPVLGKQVNVAPVSGKVFIAVPAKGSARGSARASQKGLRFVPLRQARQVPIGSFLDTRKGTVRLQSARNAKGTRQSGNFTAGIFQSRQSRRRSAKGLTDLVLKGKFNSCIPRRGQNVRSALSRRALRRLSGNAKGRFRTRGRFSAATVRGTKWGVTDRCDNTLTKVTRGRVAVRDFRRKKTIIVRAGKSYTARAVR